MSDREVTRWQCCYIIPVHFKPIIQTMSIAITKYLKEFVVHATLLPSSYFFSQPLQNIIGMYDRIF